MEDVFALGGHVQTADDVHQRAFAAARGAEYGEVFPLPDVQVYAAQDGHVLVGEVVALADALHVEKLFSHALTTYMPPGKRSRLRRLRHCRRSCSCPASPAAEVHASAGHLAAAGHAAAAEEAGEQAASGACLRLLDDIDCVAVFKAGTIST